MRKLSKRISFILFSLLLMLFILVYLVYRSGFFFGFLISLPNSPLELTSLSKSAESVTLSKELCGPDLWKYVYLPTRLLIIKPCVAVSGVIVGIQQEEDGDNHIYFKPDQDNPNLINEFNRLIASSNIVGEVVCLNKKDILSEAAKSCLGYENKIAVPPVGSHVKIFGYFVIDKSVGWTELHPITAIKNF